MQVPVPRAASQPPERAQVPSRRSLGRTEQGACCAWSGAGTRVLTAKASTRLAVGSPSSPRRPSLGGRWMRWGGRGQTRPGWERSLLTLDTDQVATECDP